MTFINKEKIDLVFAEIHQQKTEKVNLSTLESPLASWMEKLHNEKPNMHEKI